MSDHTQSSFADRHIGPDADAIATMLDVIGVASLDELAAKALPAGILDALGADGLAPGLDALPPAATEHEALAELRALADANTVAVSMIGQGYYDTLTPPVLLRNILENPAWYTAYTPYQPEISQGRLEALLNFQTMVADLTGLEVANASMLDEGTAAAEAMTLMHRAVARLGRTGWPSTPTCSPRPPPCWPPAPSRWASRSSPPTCATACPTASSSGSSPSCRAPAAGSPTGPKLVEQAHERGALVAVGADLLALTLITPPGEIGADVAFGTTQRFGVPMGFGGPHAGYLAVHTKHARQLPGRLVGVSVDADGSPAYRLSLQTREQHIRRDKATSNICTAQVLLAVMAAMYASYHGADGLTGDRPPGARPRPRAGRRAGRRRRRGGARHLLRHRAGPACPAGPRRSQAAAKARGINVWRVDADHVSVACDEATTDAHVALVLEAFGATRGGRLRRARDRARGQREFLTHPAFTRYRTETAMMRYLRSLADKDIALDRSMIPLGSCTMKLNAAAEMESITWPEFGRQHPFAPGRRHPGPAQADRRPGELADRHHRLRRDLAAAQRRIAGRVRRAAGDPGLPRRARRDRTATSA